MIVPILLALGIVGLVYSTRRKDAASSPAPVPIPESPNRSPEQSIPPIVVPQLPSVTQPRFSRFVNNPLIRATDPTGNCKSNETWIPISDPRIAWYPHALRVFNSRGEQGICVLTEFLP